MNTTQIEITWQGMNMLYLSLPQTETNKRKAVICHVAAYGDFPINCSLGRLIIDHKLTDTDPWLLASSIRRDMEGIKLANLYVTANG